ncbi:uncharacterized protein C1orf131 homolog isoform X1 [Syngnathus acus]|uniref:uncharacterized protein C1orf131 homolog isoform X1 n=1 Tax=Syngnathus acus TaxID=161584 RepID=UPI001885E152|nr:uncharacterized protein C1orf131 homolog isoform X1 [Syngnathus acus]
MKPDTTEAVDDDCALLEQILDTLYDIGSVKTKKKQKRCQEEASSEEVAKVETFDEDQGGGQKPSEVPVHNQGPAVNPVSDVEVVTFQDPAKRQKTQQMPAGDETILQKTSEMLQSASEQGVSFEKARLEVHRFGITGYKKEQQRVYEKERAIMLGARPPKKNYLNYKVLQQQIKDKKTAQKEAVKSDSKKKKKNPSRDYKKTPASGSSSAPTGQVGRFKDGILILSQKDIKTMKSKMQRK